MYIYMYVGTASFQGIEYRNTAVNIASDGVDANIYPGTGILGTLQLRYDIAAFDIAIIPYLPIKEDSHAPVGGCMYVEISVHLHCV